MSSSFKKLKKFRSIFNKPPLLVSNNFSLWISDNNSSLVQFGVIVLKKNVKLAVNRNYAKRVARELFKIQCARFNHKDVLLIIKKVELTHLCNWKKKLQGVYDWANYFGNKNSCC